VQKLIKYDAACQALAEAKRVDEVKDIRDMAIAVQAYARQAQNKELEADAVEIRMRATRRLGQLMEQQKETIGLNQGGRPSKTGVSHTPVSSTLASQGINKNLAKNARKFSAPSEEEFDRLVTDAREAVSRATRTVMRQAEIEEARRSYSSSLEQGGTVSDLRALAASGKRFGVIYADPPWEFKVYSGKGKQRSAERHYDTASLDVIKSLPVEMLAENHCALLMWAVMPELPGALDVIQAWGFEYKTAAFLWVKATKKSEVVQLDGTGLHWGMGYWTRANAELCLLATRGSPTRLAMDVHQVVIAPLGEHSAKPEEVRHRIERLLPGPYLELFGRRSSPGWMVWGNEIVAEAAE
jgi:N6-adenosine-specific RNA methylase IME4